MRADVMPEALHIVGAAQQMFVNVFAEDDFLLDRDGGIEIHFQLARTFRPARELDPELFPGERFEIGGVAPKLILRERLRVMQPDDERGVNVVEEAVEAIADVYRRMPDQLRALAPVE